MCLRCIPRLLVLTAFAIGTATAAQAQLVQFDWTSETSGSAGGISASVAWVILAGDNGIWDSTATDEDFVAQFGTTLEGLLYLTPVPGAADIQSIVSFSSSLPAGSRLVVVDVDYEGETMTLRDGASSAPLALVEQLETFAGESSDFPSWSPPTLSETTSPLATNSNEASVFDVGGLTSVEIDFAGGDASGVAVIVAIPAAPIPAFDAVGRAVLAAALAGTAALAGLRRRSALRANAAASVGEQRDQ